MPIEMKPVDSSGIAAVGYDAPNSELHIQFKSGPTVYVRSGVTPEQHEQFMASDSIGRHYHQHLRGNPKEDWRPL